MYPSVFSVKDNCFSAVSGIQQMLVLPIFLSKTPQKTNKQTVKA